MNYFEQIIEERDGMRKENEMLKIELESVKIELQAYKELSPKTLINKEVLDEKLENAKVNVKKGMELSTDALIAAKGVFGKAAAAFKDEWKKQQEAKKNRDNERE